MEMQASGEVAPRRTINTWKCKAKKSYLPLRSSGICAEFMRWGNHGSGIVAVSCVLRARPHAKEMTIQKGRVTNST